MRQPKVSKQERTVVAGFPDADLPNNKIKNTKYTVWSFLPMNLYEQFHLPMNAYFLLIAVLQLWKDVTASNPWTTWVPLIFIFAVSAIRELFDEIKRAKADKIANSKIIKCVVNGEIKKVHSEDLKVGDIIYLENNDEIPCDMILLSTSNDGMCYIQTANIDGETDLKVRMAPKETQSTLQKPNDFINLCLRATCPPPDCHIYQFDASMEYKKNTIPLSSDNLLLQVTKIKDTDYVYGLCVYTGNETKFGMNKSIAPMKVAKFDKIINYFSVFIFCFQLILAILLGIIGMIEYLNPQPWYLTRVSLYDRLSWIIFPIRFLLLNSSMIPISLKVTMEISKIFYSFFIEKDPVFNTKEKNVYFNSSYLAEGLGEIKYIMTDKTGTLTKNEMSLKKLYCNNYIYSLDTSYIHKEDVNEQTRMLIRNILVNNSLKISITDSSFSYSGVSPEEMCTVSAISSLGRLYSHDEKSNEIEIDLFGEKEHYKVIHFQEFNSNRKRTSVIVYFEEGHEYYLFAKGADDVIFPRCLDIQQLSSAAPLSKHKSKKSYSGEKISIMEAVDTFCGMGLRALTYCYRKMEETEVHSVLKTIHEAETVLVNREQAKDEAYNQFEINMTSCGACGIEDALQDNVAQSIQELKSANIHVWMITGDKPKTAVEIGKTTGIINPLIPEENILFLEGKSKRELLEIIDKSIEDVQQKKSTVSVVVPEEQEEVDSSLFSLIITGYTLVYILEKYSRKDIKSFKLLHEKNNYKDVDVDNNEEDLSILLYIKFYTLCTLMDSIVCCRVTPKQKADIVNIVNTNSKDICLAIGDGGNDVNMIQAASIGVGIEGKEGKQAARAADYVMSEFQHLPRLVLYHGYNSHRRSSYICLYSYFKSIVFCITQTCYNFTTMLSGIAIYNSLYMATYNVILFLPIMAFTTDKYYIENKKSKAYYQETQNDSFISYPTFFFWVLVAILTGVLNLVLNPSLFPSYSFDDAGHVFFFNNLLVQDIIMLLFTSSITPYEVFFILLSHVLFVLFAFLFNILYSFKGFVPYLSFNSTYSCLLTYINKFVSVCFTLIVFLFSKSYLSTHKQKFGIHL